MERSGNGFRRAPSAGYQLPATSPAGKLSSSPSLSSTLAGRATLATHSVVKLSSETTRAKQEALKADQVRQDKVWREFVEAENRATKSWYQNWSFLKDYDPLGKKKEPEHLPKYMPVFSDKIPNTNNHIIGSRMNTDVGKTLVKMDYFLNYGRRKNKLEVDFQPS